MNKLQIIGGRRTGKTTILLSHIHYMAKKESGIRILVVAPMWTTLNHLRDQLLNMVDATYRTRDCVELLNGSKIYFKTSEFRGLRPDVVAIDEESFVSREVHLEISSMQPRDLITTRLEESNEERGILE